MVTVRLHDDTYAIINTLLKNQLEAAETVCMIHQGVMMNDFTEALKGAIQDFKEGVVK